MKTVCLYIALIFFIAGCQTSYKHPTKAAKDLERDKHECEKIAAKLAKDAGEPDNPFLIRDEMNRCLELKFGWTQVER